MVSDVSLPDVVAAAVQELQSLAHGHAFDVRIATEDGTVRTDEDKVHQIVSNLLENGVKYSPPDTRITVRVEDGIQGVLIAVEDEGPGIAPEQRERVFDRFYQVDQSATRKVGGTGLGLYICRKLAEEIGARLWLEPSETRGSMFCLFVPRTPRGGRIKGGPEEPGQSMTATV
ncbi:MAG: ATP-binding protein [Actinomycetota bacterium]